MNLCDLFEEPVLPQQEKQLVQKPPSYEESLKDILEGKKQMSIDPQYFAETRDLPPEYEEEDKVNYGLDDEDMDNEILNDLGIQNYDSVEKVLNQQEMTQQKNKKYLNKIIDAKTRRNQRKGYKSALTKKFKSSSISKAVRQIENERIDNARVALNSDINHYENEVKTMKVTKIADGAGYAAADRITIINGAHSLIKHLMIKSAGCQIQAICWFINGRSSDDVNSPSSPKVGWAPEVCRGAWLPSTERNVSDFLQINLGYEFYICAAATQGNTAADQWTTKFMIHTSLDNITWTTYKENGTEKVFHGNTGRNDIVKHNLEEVIIARFIRFQPIDFFGHKALRVELYGALKSLVPVEAPILVKLTAQSSTSVAAYWKLSKRYYNERKLMSFKLLYQREGSNVPQIQIIKDAKIVRIENGLWVFSSEVTGLEKFTEYEFKVCVFSSVGCGPKSSSKIARTWEDVPSKAPSNFTVTANTSTAIIASWQLPSPDSRHGIIRGFKIFIRKEGSDINRLENISVSNVTMYTKNVTGLAKFTQYGFHVLAFTSAGDGMNSSVEFARTKEDIPSKAPSKFAVTANTSTSVTASWQLPPTGSRNGIIKGFKLLINRKGSEDKPNVQLVNASNAAVYTKTVTGLQESTEYELQVLAYTSPGDGPKSSAQFVTTKGSGKKHWILTVVTVVSFILALMVTLFCYLVWRHRRRKRKMAFFAQKYAQEGPDCQFTHDVFVSYSSKDYDWVKDNLQPLFDGSNIEYIIHSRDFIPGKAFFDNMADSVYSSRKVIFVMSRNYLSSGFCKDEMDMALFRAARNDENRSLIVVKIDDVKPQDIPKSLRHKTFIDYTSKEEATTWKKRILEFVSIANRSLSASMVEELVDTLDTKSLIPSKFTLKRKKEQLSGLLTKVCCKTKVNPACQQSLS
ncbi:uncharacterized protein [Montipora foliosa]|uniref:uncharacterized protein n=1 Tax=Montipora foliosa TaxID=591990 RepID=UPI0035F20130